MTRSKAHTAYLCMIEFGNDLHTNYLSVEEFTPRTLREFLKEDESLLNEFIIIEENMRLDLINLQNILTLLKEHFKTKENTK